MNERPKLRWPPKLRPEKLSALYRSSAAGMLDDVLLDDVGIALYLRCEAIVMIGKGELYCPDCRAKLCFAPGDAEVACACGRRITRRHYGESYRHRDLWQGNAADCFIQYYTTYPLLRAPGERLVAIDTLIHAFHIDARQNLPNRAAANNLIEGSLKDVVAFLDTLSGIQPESDERFRETAEVMWRRRTGKG